MSEEEKDGLFKQLLSKITSTMTDRAAVMKAFDKKLESFIKSKVGDEFRVYFLHCNAHCLLGFSRACEQALKTAEEDIIHQTGEQLGRDRAPCFARFNKAETATRLIRTASDICGPRGDDKNGCRADWLAFCEENRKKSLLTSYRSNRFNSFFLGTAALLFHREDLQSFLTDGYLGHTNMKIDSVRADIGDNNLLSLVCAVALLYLRVTGPYWKLLQSQVKHTDFHVYVQKMEACFDRWREHPLDVLNANYGGIFDGEFELNCPTAPVVYKFAEEHSEAVSNAIQRMMGKMLVTTRAQLIDFLQNGQYVTAHCQDIAQTLNHCPLTNLTGENAFGELDFDINKRRHTSLHHRSSTQMWRANKTAMWLSRKGEQEQSKLMSLARKHGKYLRRRHMQQEKIVRLAVRENIIENARRKREKEAKRAPKNVALIRAVLGHGGPCECKADVQKLKRKLKRSRQKPSMIREAIKNEIRFQKTVRTQRNLKLSGTLADLLKRLQDCLPEHCPEDDKSSDPEPATPPLSFQSRTADGADEPQPKRRKQTAEDVTDEEHSSAVPDEPFQFHSQGQWVAVFFNDRFYIGQVIEVVDPSRASVQYLSQLSARKDCFRWPSVDDVAVTEAVYVFDWDFQVVPLNRLWHVPDAEVIQQKYDMIKRRSTE